MNIIMDISNILFYYCDNLYVLWEYKIIDKDNYNFYKKACFFKLVSDICSILMNM